MIDFGYVQFRCDECSICEDFERRCEIAKELDDDVQFNYCWCDKIDDYFWAGGYCEDAWTRDRRPKRRGERKTGSAYRRAMNVKKRDKLMRIVGTGYKTHVGWVDGDWIDGEWKQTGRYVKFPKNSKREKYLKKQSNRRVRRSDEILKGNQYRKQSEYWWILY